MAKEQKPRNNSWDAIIQDGGKALRWAFWIFVIIVLAHYGSHG